MKNILIFILLINVKLFAQFSFPPPAPFPIQNIDNIIYSGYNLGGVTYYNQTYKNELIIAQNAPVLVNDNSYVDFISDNLITIKPDFDVNNLGPISVFSAKIGQYDTDNDPSPFSAMILSNHPNANLGSYERFEIGIEPPVFITNSVDNFLNGGVGINPYDYDQIRFEATVTYLEYTNASSLQEKQLKWNSFYFKDFNITPTSFTPINTALPFRIRLALGYGSTLASNTMDLKINMFINNVKQVGSFRSVITLHDTPKKGFLSLNGNNKIRADKKNNHFLIGQAVPYAIENSSYGINHASFETQRSYISDLANKGGNFVRIRMDINSNAIEWDEAGVYGSKRTYNFTAGRPENFDRQFHAWELDKTLELCESNDMDMMLCLESDQYLSGSGYDPYAWPTGPNNTSLPRYPYKTLLGVNTPEDVFTNSQAIKFFKQRIAYINARWGYSSNMGMYELLNETDNTGNNISGYNNYSNNPSLRSSIMNWHCVMNNYIKSLYPNHLTLTGYAGWPNSDDNSYSCMDIESRNSYLSNQGANFDNRTVYRDGLSKPFIIGEMGHGCYDIDRQNDISFHNDTWATAFMGHIGCGVHWSDWEQIGGIDHRSNYTFMNSFFSTVDFDLIKWHPGKIKSSGSSKEIVSFFMTDKHDNSDYAIGYAHNYSYSPYSNGFSGTFADQSCDALGYPSINGYYIFDVYPNPEVEVGNLKLLKYYDIDFFDARTGVSLGSHHLNTGFYNTLKARINLDYMDGSGTSASVVYKVTNSCLGCKIENNQNISLNYTYKVNDSIKINIPNSLKVIPSSLSWSKDGNIITTNSELNYVFNQTGDYIITTQFIDSTNRQYTITNNFKIIPNEKIMDDGISVYPNPSTGLFNLKYNTDKVNILAILVYDIQGKLIINTTQPNVKSIDLSAYTNGMYFIRLIKNNETATPTQFKVIKY